MPAEKQFRVLVNDESYGVYYFLATARKHARRFPGYEIWEGREDPETHEFISEARVEHCEDLTGCDDDRVLQGLGRPNYSEVVFPPDLPHRER